MWKWNSTLRSSARFLWFRQARVGVVGTAVVDSADAIGVEVRRGCLVDDGLTLEILRWLECHVGKVREILDSFALSELLWCGVFEVELGCPSGCVNMEGLEGVERVYIKQMLKMRSFNDKSFLFVICAKETKSLISSLLPLEWFFRRYLCILLISSPDLFTLNIVVVCHWKSNAAIELIVFITSIMHKFLLWITYCLRYTPSRLSNAFWDSKI